MNWRSHSMYCAMRRQKATEVSGSTTWTRIRTDHGERSSEGAVSPHLRIVSSYSAQPHTNLTCSPPACYVDMRSFRLEVDFGNSTAKLCQNTSQRHLTSPQVFMVSLSVLSVISQPRARPCSYYPAIPCRQP